MLCAVDQGCYRYRFEDHQPGFPEMRRRRPGRQPAAQKPYWFLGTRGHAQVPQGRRFPGRRLRAAEYQKQDDPQHRHWPARHLSPLRALVLVRDHRGHRPCGGRCHGHRRHERKARPGKGRPPAAPRISEDRREKIQPGHDRPGHDRKGQARAVVFANYSKLKLKS